MSAHRALMYNLPFDFRLFIKNTNTSFFFVLEPLMQHGFPGTWHGNITLPFAPVHCQSPPFPRSVYSAAWRPLKWHPWPLAAQSIRYSLIRALRKDLELLFQSDDVCAWAYLCGVHVVFKEKLPGEKEIELSRRAASGPAQVLLARWQRHFCSHCIQHTSRGRLPKSYLLHLITFKWFFF